MTLSPRKSSVVFVLLYAPAHRLRLEHPGVSAGLSTDGYSSLVGIKLAALDVDGRPRT